MKAHGEKGLVDHGHHVVLKTQYTVINVQLCQFFFVDADLVLLLYLNDPRLHLLPGEIRKIRLRKAQKNSVEIVCSKLLLVDEIYT